MAALTKTDICNLSLQRIGWTDRLEDVDTDEGVAAEACVASYPIVLDEILAEHHWPHARKVVALGLASGYPISDDTKWSYAYGFPSDCIRPKHIGTDPQRLPVEFEIGSASDNSPLIFTDEASAVLTYTYRNTATAYFPPLFSDALGWRLAVDLAHILPRDAGLAQRMRSGYLETLSVAVGMAESSHKPYTRAKARSVRARA